MWDALAFIGFLAFIVSLIGLIINAVKRNIVWKKWLAALGVAFVLFVVGIANASPTEQAQTTKAPSQQTETKPEEEAKADEEPGEKPDDKSAAKEEKPTETIPSGQMKVHFINVGQGDSILIQFHNGQTMLIDAGPDDSVVSYLNQQGIKKINYLVATHPHADHIGEMATVIRTFDIEKVYMPRVTHTTKTYENVLLAIKAKGLKITPARAGTTVLNQEGVKVDIVAPCGSSYDNLNNYSAVVRILHGNTSFLLTGDAESLSEQQMLSSGANLKADVLKVGHHGSSTSTTQSFLKAVSPKYGVISCGSGNQYGHPHKETISKLANAGVKIYRTDTHGTVVFVTDGKTITVKALGSSIQPRAPNKTTSDKIASTPDKKTTSDKNAAQTSGNFIGNKNTKKLHKPTCSSLPAEHNRVYFDSRDKAVGEGYVPCKRCKP